MSTTPSPDDICKAVRNQLRTYRSSSVAEVALVLLHRRFPSVDAEMQSAPWLILSMVKWVLQDALAKDVGPPIRPDGFLALQRRLWNMGDPAQMPPLGNLHRFVRSLAYVQLEFQRPETFEFTRWPGLLDRLPSDNPARAQFEAATGLTPTDFLDLAWAIYAPVLGGKNPLGAKDFEPLRKAYGEKIDVIIGLLSRDLQGLRQELLSDASLGRRTGANLLFEAPSFRRFPFIRSASGLHFCWHKRVLARGLDEFVHHKLAGSGDTYASPYARVFEKYVVELAKNTGLPALEEREYLSRFGGNKRAVEVILHDDRCNILIEAKFGVYQDEYMTLDDARFANAKLGKLRSGVSQAADVSWRLSLADDLHPWTEREHDFVLLVTNRQLYIPTGRQLELISSPTANEIDERARLETTEKLAVDNVFILSLEEYERLMTEVADGRVRLSDVLRSVSKSVAETQGFTMDAGQLLARYGPMRNISPLVQSTVEASIARVCKALGQEYDPSREPWRSIHASN